ncbi:MAG: hypothetical protein QM803_09300 [Rhodocyclaceae bacterium]
MRVICIFGACWQDATFGRHSRPLPESAEALATEHTPVTQFAHN